MKKSGVFADLQLACRLETAEALRLTELVRARARDFPESEACWREEGGVYAIFDGVTSPATQTFGLGLFAPVTAEVLEQLKAFFNERNAPVYHTISSLAQPSLWPLLTQHGYQPIAVTHVLYCVLQEKPTGYDLQQHRQLLAETTHSSRAGNWEEPADFMLGLAANSTSKGKPYSLLADLPAPTDVAGELSFQQGVAVLPEHIFLPPGQQDSREDLPENPLQLAVENGCDLAMISTMPGSVVQRNAESEGFQIAYTRIKWQQPQKADYWVFPPAGGESSANRPSEDFPG